VSADEKDLARPPALAGALKGPGRVYVAPRLADPSALPAGGAHPALPQRIARLSRAQIEELIPLTGAPFHVRYVFDQDPDGSYGYYNRLASEALAASKPDEASRLLRAYGARWVLEDQGAARPFLRPVTGFEVAGRRLLLSEVPDPVAELRWVSRRYRRTSLSGALDLVRSDHRRRATSCPGARPGTEGRGPGILRAARAGRQLLGRVPNAVARVVFRRTLLAWKARLDGRPVPVLVANARDLAIAVPAGIHHVEFQYDRAPFHRGVLLQTAAFVLSLLATTVLGLSHRRRLR
jgi:hypothetical protein